MKVYTDKICWCCLKTDVDMKSLVKSPLVQDYLNLAGIKVNSWDPKPQWLCLICSREIKKARVFQAKVKNSYNFIISLQGELHNEKIKEESIGESSLMLERVLPCLSQSVLELWCTPEDQADFYDDFLMEESDIKNDESYDSDNTPLLKVEAGDEKTKTSDTTPLSHIEQCDDINAHKEQSIHLKRKKNKKSKKKGKTKKKAKQSSVIIRNRMVIQTEQYNVIRLTPAQVIEEKEKNLNSTKYKESVYKCELCAKGYLHEDVYANHMSFHERKANYLECRICHQFLASKISLRGHTKCHLIRYECRECGEVRASRQHLLEHHSLQHGSDLVPPRRYTCNTCGKTMMKRTMFQKHVKLHSLTSRFPCEMCGKTLKTLETLRAHKLRHNSDWLNRPKKLKQYKCPDCSKEFGYSSSLYSHRITHIKTRDFYCVECDLSFKTQTNLRLHLNRSKRHIDPDSLKFQCDGCGKRFATEERLKHHFETIHMGKKEHNCPSCDKKYASKDTLRVHIRREHPAPGFPAIVDLPKHICDICSRAFKAKAVLIKHIRTHTGERPFQCTECLRAFSQQSTLTAHIKIVHRHEPKRVRPSKSKVAAQCLIQRNISNTS